MTTNRVQTEALEKIANQKDFCVLHETDWNRLECDGCSVDFCPRYIARKALAPQECDAEKCEFYYKGSFKEAECDCNSQNYDVKCHKNQDCLYRKWQRAEQQLHSQEKTFTVEEIKGKLEYYRTKNKFAYNTDIFCKELLAEFEKGK